EHSADQSSHATHVKLLNQISKPSPFPSTAPTISESGGLATIPGERSLPTPPSGSSPKAARGHVADRGPRVVSMPPIRCRPGAFMAPRVVPRFWRSVAPALLASVGLAVLTMVCARLGLGLAPSAFLCLMLIVLLSPRVGVGGSLAASLVGIVSLYA